MKDWNIKNHLLIHPSLMVSMPSTCTFLNFFPLNLVLLWVELSWGFLFFLSKILYMLNFNFRVSNDCFPKTLNYTKWIQFLLRLIFFSKISVVLSVCVSGSHLWGIWSEDYYLVIVDSAYHNLYLGGRVKELT